MNFGRNVSKPIDSDIEFSAMSTERDRNAQQNAESNDRRVSVEMSDTAQIDFRTSVEISDEDLKKVVEKEGGGDGGQRHDEERGETRKKVSLEIDTKDHKTTTTTTLSDDQTAPPPPPPEDLYGRVKEWLFPKTPPKFGTFTGVFARCLLNIWGVIMFLRLGWMIAHAGLLLSLSIVGVAMAITTVTTLSLSAICTNGIIGGGGAYFLLSRSLGPAFGGSIGVLFSLANATAVALHLVGFAETITSLLDKIESDFTIADGAGDGLWDLRIYAIMCLVVLIAVGLVGVSYVVKLQLNFLWLLIVSLVCYFVGTFYSADDSYAFTGYNATTLKDNLGPDFQGSETWITLFAVFFPASTGIMAGANISGDLKDAQRSIPVGTLWAVFVSGVTYVFMLVSIAATVERKEYKNGNGDPGLYNDYLVMYDMSAWPVSVIIGIVASALSSALAALVGAPRVFQAVCEDGLFPSLEFLGKTTVVSSGSPEPLRLYGVTFVIAVCVILIGDLNAIAPYITNFFMISYALINYAAFIASHDNSPGWRPKWKYYNKYVALGGAFSCVGAMVMISWYTGLITLIIAFLLYKYVDYSPITKNWGNIHKSMQYSSAVNNVYKLEKSYRQSSVHVKNFRPAYLVMAGPVNARPDLVKFTQQLRYGGGITVVANVLRGGFDKETRRLMSERELKYYSMNKFKVVPMALCSPSLIEGGRTLLQTAGVGVLSPNTVVMNFKILPSEDGKARREETGRDTSMSQAMSAKEYVQFLMDALKMNMGFVLLKGYSHRRRRESREIIPVSKLPSLEHGEITSELVNDLHRAGLFRSYDLDIEDDETDDGGLDALDEDDGGGDSKQGRHHAMSDTKLSSSSSHHDDMDVKIASPERTSRSPSRSPSKSIRRDGSYSPHHRRRATTNEHSYTGKGTFARLPGIWKKALLSTEARAGRIDIYWLCDHGGLTVLIPHLLRKNPTWRRLKLRVLVPWKKENGDVESGRGRQQDALESVLKKLRIDATARILPEIEELNVFFANSDEELKAIYDKAHNAQLGIIDRSMFDASPTNNDRSRRDADNDAEGESKTSSGRRGSFRFSDVVSRESDDATMVFITTPHPDTKNPVKYLRHISAWTHRISHVPVVYVHGTGNRVLSIEA